MGLWLILTAMAALPAEAKIFKNSYISFEVPDSWNCAQEGVAWTCLPKGPLDSREAVIVMAAKVAGPEDNLVNFRTFLGQPKKLATRVGTPMPSQVMYAQERTLAGTKWIQAQHLGSEIQQFYTLYLATVKDALAIMVSFSAEKSRYAKYNPVFDRAIKTLKITANNQLLFPKNKLNPTTDVIGIAPNDPGGVEDRLPPPPQRAKSGTTLPILVLIGAAAILIVVLKKKRASKPKTK